MMLTFKLENKWKPGTNPIDWFEKMQGYLNDPTKPSLGFFGKRELYTKDFETFVMYVDVLPPRFYLFGLLGIFSYFIWHVKLALVGGVFILITGLPYHMPFWYYALWFGLRKHGYKGWPKPVTKETVIKQEVLGIGSD